MKRAANHKSGVYIYLQSQGLLQAAPEVIQRAKKAYWNQVKREWKKQRSKQEKSFCISFSKTELTEICEAAALHNMSRSRLIKQASLMYLRKKYLIPNVESIQNINSLLSLNYSSLQELHETDMIPSEIGSCLLHKMTQLEQSIKEQLLNPQSTDR